MKRLKMWSHRKITKHSLSPQDTFNIAKDLVLRIKNGPFLIGLNGELGVGKTVFSKGFAEGLGLKELVTSPTFLGISEYYSGKIPFIHMDFYKKVSPIEVIDSYLKKDSVVLIEWVENFKQVFNKELPLNISVYIQYGKNKNEREISMLYC